MRLVRLLALSSLAAAGCGGKKPAVPRRQASIDKIDVHTHYFAERGYLIPLLQRWRMRAVILNYTMGEPDSLVRRRWAGVVALQRTAPDRFLLATTFDPKHIDQPDFATHTIAQLQHDFDQGAVMVKIWKDLGMQVRDARGAFVQIDDPRLQPIWDFLSARHVPVLAHTADPHDGWRPLDPKSPHYEYFSTHPEFYPYKHPEMPTWETILAATDRWLARNPHLTVIGAHLGSMADDLDGLGRRLDSFPNFNVDVSARLSDLRRLPPDRVRRFFSTYQDRILFGADRSTEGPEAGKDTVAVRREKERTEVALSGWWDYVTRTLNLPGSTITKFYSANAIRLLRLGEARLGSGAALAVAGVDRRR